MLATIDPFGTAGAPAPLSAVNVPPLHKPAFDIRGFPIAQRREIVFTENNPAGLFYINGKRYDPNAAPDYVAAIGTVEQWTIVNKTRELHAFHIHQIHFLVEAIDGIAQGTEQLYLDTVTVPAAEGTVPGTARLLMDFTDPIIKGTFVFHCHILEHEDGGMMAKITLR